MKKFTKSIRVAASAKDAFEIIRDPLKLHEVWPSLVEVKNLQTYADGSCAFDFTYKMAGLRFHGRCEPQQYVKPQSLDYVCTGGIEATFHWRLTQADGLLTLSCEVGYRLPVPVLGRLGEALVERQNEREFETVLQNIKARCEHGLPTVVVPEKPKGEELRH